MIERYRERAERGEISEQFLRGYLIAMFHAGAVEQDELGVMLNALAGDAGEQEQE